MTRQSRRCTPVAAAVKHVMVPKLPLLAAVTAISAAGLLAVPAPAHADCAKYNYFSFFQPVQSNGVKASMNVSSDGSVPGAANFTIGTGPVSNGTAKGKITGAKLDTIDIKVTWTEGPGAGSSSHYVGSVNPADNFASGTVTQAAGANVTTDTWRSRLAIQCDPAPAKQAPTPAANFVKITEDVDLYDAPGGVGEPFGFAPKGERVLLLQCRADRWCQISNYSILPDGSPSKGAPAWVFADFLGL